MSSYRPVSTTAKHMAIRSQETGVFKTTVDLDHLIIGVKVQVKGHRVGLMLGCSHAKANSTVVTASPGVNVSSHIQNYSVSTARCNLYNALEIGY